MLEKRLHQCKTLEKKVEEKKQKPIKEKLAL